MILNSELVRNLRGFCLGSLYLVILPLALGLSACSKSPESEQGMTPLLLAAKAGETQKVKAALSEGAQVNETSAYGWTALMFAAWQGHEDVVKLLLDTGADPNHVSKWVAKNTQAPLPETTALAQALKNKHLSIARLLLERGAEADSVAVAIAGGLEDLSLLQQMHASGSQLSDNPGNMYHYSPLREACRNGRLTNVQWLLELDVPADFNDLKAAIGQSHFDIVQLLVEAGVSSGWFSPQTLSEAFVFAATKRNPGPNPELSLKIVEYLLAQGADPQFRPDSGEVKGKTAVEFLKQKCLLAKELIEKNRFGAKQQAGDQAWLDHMESVVQLIEMAR